MRRFFVISSTPSFDVRRHGDHYVRLSAWDFGPVFDASLTHHRFRFGLLHRQHGLRSSFRIGGGAMLSGCTFPDSSLPWVFCCHPIARVVVRAAVCLPSSPPGCGTSSTSFKLATAHDTLLPFQRSWSSIAPAYLIFLLAPPFWDTRTLASPFWDTRSAVPSLSRTGRLGHAHRSTRP